MNVIRARNQIIAAGACALLTAAGITACSSAPAPGPAATGCRIAVITSTTESEPT
jgi:hypothetical protein